MIGEFQKFVGNRILAWFLTHPTTTLGINPLARELGISPGSMKRYADLLEEDGFLTVTRAGTAHLLSLNNDDPIVRELKRCCMALLLREAGITGIAPGCISLSVYGSVATGTHDERSDIDVLVIGEEGDMAFDRIQGIEHTMGHEVQVTVLPYFRWEELKRQGDSFAANVLACHILFAGAEP
jgi:predicted nucleotidyltransferase